MKRAFVFALCLAAAPVGAAPQPSSLARDAQDRENRGQWLWAAELWRKAAASPEGAFAVERLASLERLAAARAADGSLPLGERLYFETLRHYALFDEASLWVRWKALSRISAYSEEAGWFLVGPESAFHENVWADPRWARAGERFQEAWRRIRAEEWSAALPGLRDALAARPEHVMAAHYLRLCEERLAAEAARRAAMPSWETFRGSDAERMVQGLAEFRAGHWARALGWFRSAGSPEALRAARRLEWMFVK